MQFYSVIKDKLEPIKPLAKFLAVKSIVFLTWWQGVAVAFLFSIGALKGSLAQELKTRIQDYIICIEVVVRLPLLLIFPLLLLVLKFCSVMIHCGSFIYSEYFLSSFFCSSSLTIIFLS